MAIENPEDEVFKKAVIAVVDGDRQTLSRLIAQYPQLPEQKSSQPHKATLLHYLMANGVEDHLQRTPVNAVEIARLLIDSGAKVDVTAGMYGGGPYQTPLNNLVSSWWPFKAGVQSDLVRLLVRSGANPNGLLNDGAPLGMAIAFGYRKAAETLALEGADYHNLIFAAALGKTELVSSFFSGDDKLTIKATAYKVNEQQHSGRFSWPPPKDKNPREIAFIFACLHGREEVVKFLLDKGVSMNCCITHQQTGLHYGAYTGNLALIKLLLAYGADANLIETQFNKTPIDWAVETDEFEAISLLNLHTLPQYKKQLSHAAPVFPVPDVSASADYYQNKLGFEIKYLWGDPPTYAVLQRQGVGIHLSQKTDDFKPSQKHVAYYIFVYDVEGLFREFKENGVEILNEPVEREYGMVDFDIRDLNGYILSFARGT